MSSTQSFTKYKSKGTSNLKKHLRAGKNQGSRLTKKFSSRPSTPKSVFTKKKENISISKRHKTKHSLQTTTKKSKNSAKGKGGTTLRERSLPRQKPSKKKRGKSLLKKLEMKAKRNSLMADLKNTNRFSQTGEAFLDFAESSDGGNVIKRRRASRSRGKLASLHNSSRRSSQRKQLISSLNENVYRSQAGIGAISGRGPPSNFSRKEMDPEVELYKFKKRKSAIDAQIKKIIEPLPNKKSRTRLRSQKRKITIRTKEYRSDAHRQVVPRPSTPNPNSSTKKYNSGLQGINLEKYGIRSKRLGTQNFKVSKPNVGMFRKHGSFSARSGDEKGASKLMSGYPGLIFPIEEMAEGVGPKKIGRRTAAAKLGVKGRPSGYRKLYKLKKEGKARLRKANLKSLAKYYPGSTPNSGPLFH